FVLDVQEDKCKICHKPFRKYERVFIEEIPDFERESVVEYVTYIAVCKACKDKLDKGELSYFEINRQLKQGDI
ncbi:MAG: hypothetical protein QW478_08365, partial [Candidatus Micrarchaeaceae archaeon]